MREPRLHILGFFALCIGSTQSVTCPQDQYTAQTQKYKVEFENDATWKFSEFAAYTQAPMLDRACKPNLAKLGHPESRMHCF